MQRSDVPAVVREAILGHSAKGKTIESRYISISDAELLKAIDMTTFDHGRTEIYIARPVLPRSKINREKSSFHFPCNLSCLIVAGATRLELATSGVTGSRPILWSDILNSHTRFFSEIPQLPRWSFGGPFCAEKTILHVKWYTNGSTKIEAILSSTLVLVES